MFSCLNGVTVNVFAFVAFHSGISPLSPTPDINSQEFLYWIKKIFYNLLNMVHIFAPVYSWDGFIKSNA